MQRKKFRTKQSFYLYKRLNWFLSFSSLVPNSCKYHCCLSLLLYFLFIVWALIYFHHADSVQSLDFVITIFSAISIEISILQLNFFNKEKFSNLMKNLKRADFEIYKTYRVEPKINFMIKFKFISIIFSNIIFIFMEVLIAVVYFSFSFSLQHLAQYLPFPAVALIIAQYCFLVDSIRRNCELLKFKLSEQLNHIFVYKNITKVQIRSLLLQTVNSQFFANNYDRIFDSIYLVNDIFGVQILFIFVIIQLFSVKALDIILSFISESVIKFDRILILFSNLWGCFIFLVNTILNTCYAFF